jgi:hypothetical protein
MATRTPARMDVRVAVFLTVLLGIAALIVSVKGTPHKVELPPNDDLHENITLSVIFSPSPRTQAIDVQAHVEGAQVVNERPIVSPWNKIIRVPRGASIILYAYQPDAGWKKGPNVWPSLDCLISHSKGVFQPHGANHRNTPGSIRCYANQPPR